MSMFIDIVNDCQCHHHYHYYYPYIYTLTLLRFMHPEVNFEKFFSSRNHEEKRTPNILTTNKHKNTPKLSSKKRGFGFIK